MNGLDFVAVFVQIFTPRFVFCFAFLLLSVAAQLEVDRLFFFFFFGKAPLDVHCFFVFLIICILKSPDNHIFICPAFSVRERWCVSVPCSAAHVSQ